MDRDTHTDNIAKDLLDRFPERGAAKDADRYIAAAWKELDDLWPLTTWKKEGENFTCGWGKRYSIALVEKDEAVSAHIYDRETGFLRVLNQDGERVRECFDEGTDPRWWAILPAPSEGAFFHVWHDLAKSGAPADLLRDTLADYFEGEHHLGKGAVFFGVDEVHVWPDKEFTSHIVLRRVYAQTDHFFLEQQQHCWWKGLAELVLKTREEDLEVPDEFLHEMFSKFFGGGDVPTDARIVRNDIDGKIRSLEKEGEGYVLRDLDPKEFYLEQSLQLCERTPDGEDIMSAQGEPHTKSLYHSGSPLHALYRMRVDGPYTGKTHEFIKEDAQTFQIRRRDGKGPAYRIHIDSGVTVTRILPMHTANEYIAQLESGDYSRLEEFHQWVKDHAVLDAGTIWTWRDTQYAVMATCTGSVIVYDAHTGIEKVYVSHTASGSNPRAKGLNTWGVALLHHIRIDTERLQTIEGADGPQGVRDALDAYLIALDKQTYIGPQHVVRRRLDGSIDVWADRKSDRYAHYGWHDPGKTMRYSHWWACAAHDHASGPNRLDQTELGCVFWDAFGAKGVPKDAAIVASWSDNQAKVLHRDGRVETMSRLDYCVWRVLRHCEKAAEGDVVDFDGDDGIKDGACELSNIYPGRLRNALYGLTQQTHGKDSDAYTLREIPCSTGVEIVPKDKTKRIVRLESISKINRRKYTTLPQTQDLDTYLANHTPTIEGLRKVVGASSGVVLSEKSAVFLQGDKALVWENRGSQTHRVLTAEGAKMAYGRFIHDNTTQTSYLTADSDLSIHPDKEHVVRCFTTEKGEHKYELVEREAFYAREIYTYLKNQGGVRLFSGAKAKGIDDPTFLMHAIQRLEWRSEEKDVGDYLIAPIRWAAARGFEIYPKNGDPAIRVQACGISWHRRVEILEGPSITADHLGRFLWDLAVHRETPDIPAIAAEIDILYANNYGGEPPSHYSIALGDTYALAVRRESETAITLRVTDNRDGWSQTFAWKKGHKPQTTLGKESDLTPFAHAMSLYPREDLDGYMEFWEAADPNDGRALTDFVGDRRAIFGAECVALQTRDVLRIWEDKNRGDYLKIEDDAVSCDCHGRWEKHVVQDLDTWPHEVAERACLEVLHKACNLSQTIDFKEVSEGVRKAYQWVLGDKAYTPSETLDLAGPYTQTLRLKPLGDEVYEITRMDRILVDLLDRTLADMPEWDEVEVSHDTGREILRIARQIGGVEGKSGWKYKIVESSAGRLILLEDIHKNLSDIRYEKHTGEAYHYWIDKTKIVGRRKDPSPHYVGHAILEHIRERTLMGRQSAHGQHLAAYVAHAAGVWESPEGEAYLCEINGYGEWLGIRVGQDEVTVTPLKDIEVPASTIDSAKHLADLLKKLLPCYDTEKPFDEGLGARIPHQRHVTEDGLGEYMKIGGVHVYRNHIVVPTGPYKLVASIEDDVLRYTYNWDKTACAVRLDVQGHPHGPELCICRHHTVIVPWDHGDTEGLLQGPCDLNLQEVMHDLHRPDSGNRISDLWADGGVLLHAPEGMYAQCGAQRLLWEGRSTPRPISTNEARTWLQSLQEQSSRVQELLADLAVVPLRTRDKIAGRALGKLVPHPALRLLAALVLHGRVPEKHRQTLEAVVEAELQGRGHKLVESLLGSLTEETPHDQPSLLQTIRDLEGIPS